MLSGNNSGMLMYAGLYCDKDLYIGDMGRE